MELKPEVKAAIYIHRRTEFHSKIMPLIRCYVNCYEWEHNLYHIDHPDFGRVEFDPMQNSITYSTTLIEYTGSEWIATNIVDFFHWAFYHTTNDLMS